MKCGDELLPGTPLSGISRTCIVAPEPIARTRSSEVIEQCVDLLTRINLIVGVVGNDRRRVAFRHQFDRGRCEQQVIERFERLSSLRFVELRDAVKFRLDFNRRFHSAQSIEAQKELRALERQRIIDVLIWDECANIFAPLCWIGEILGRFDLQLVCHRIIHWPL